MWLPLRLTGAAKENLVIVTTFILSLYLMFCFAPHCFSKQFYGGIRSETVSCYKVIKFFEKKMFSCLFSQKISQNTPNSYFKPSLPHILEEKIPQKSRQNPNWILATSKYRSKEKSPYSAFFAAVRRRRVFFSSSTTFSTLMPASSGSMRILPQYSHTMTFLWNNTSNCL